MAIESRKVNCRRPIMAVIEMTDCDRWVCFGPQRHGFSFDPRSGQKIEFTPTADGWDLRGNKILNKAIQEISEKKSSCSNQKLWSDHWHGARPEIPTNDIENNFENEDNADELGESGDMRARPQPRKRFRHRKLRHMIGHCPFQSRCRYCVMAASRCGPHRKTTRITMKVQVLSCDYVFLQIAVMMRKDNS